MNVSSSFKYSDKIKNERARVLETAKEYAGTKSSSFKESSYVHKEDRKRQLGKRFGHRGF